MREVGVSERETVGSFTGWNFLRRRHWSKNLKRRKELAMLGSGRRPCSIHSRGMGQRQEHAQPLEGVRSS